MQADRGVLEVYGTLNSNSTSPNADIIASSAVVRFVGSTSRALFGSNWGATTTGLVFDVALEAGTTGTAANNIKARSITISSGTFSVSGGVRPDAGTANSGTLAIRPAGTLVASSFLSRTSTAGTAFQSFTNEGTFRTTSASASVWPAATPCSFAPESAVEYAGSTQTIQVPSGSGYGHLILSGSGTKKAAGDLLMEGDLTVDGVTFDGGIYSVTFSGASLQTIGGSSETSFHDLVIDNGNDVALAQDATVDHLLALSNGRLLLGAHILMLSSSAQPIAGASFGDSRMIVAEDPGALCKGFSGTGAYTFPIGDGGGVNSTTDYSPATLSFTGGTFEPGAEVCVSVINQREPNFNQTQYPTYLNRYWFVRQTGVSSFSCGVTFRYVADDVVVGAGQSESDIHYWKYDPTLTSPWSCYSAVDTANKLLVGTIDSFSDHTGFSASPTAVTLASFAAAATANGIEVTWESASELDTLGYNLYRDTSAAGPGIKLNSSLIPSQGPGSPIGFSYSYTDSANLEPGTTYYYWLEDVNQGAVATRHEPVSVTCNGAPTAVTWDGFAGNPTWAAWPLALGGLILLGLAGIVVTRRRRA